MYEQYQEITSQLRECLVYLKNAAHLKNGAVVVMGCSTSEVAGGHIGHNSVPELGDALAMTMIETCKELESIKSVMPSSHLILCRPLLLLPPIPPSIRVFSNE